MARNSSWHGAPRTSYGGWTKLQAAALSLIRARLLRIVHTNARLDRPAACPLSAPRWNSGPSRLCLCNSSICCSTWWATEQTHLDYWLHTTGSFTAAPTLRPALALRTLHKVTLSLVVLLSSSEDQGLAAATAQCLAHFVLSASATSRQWLNSPIWAGTALKTTTDPFSTLMASNGPTRLACMPVNPQWFKSPVAGCRKDVANGSAAFKKAHVKQVLCVPSVPLGLAR